MRNICPPLAVLPQLVAILLYTACRLSLDSVASIPPVNPSFLAHYLCAAISCGACIQSHTACNHPLRYLSREGCVIQCSYDTRLFQMTEKVSKCGICGIKFTNSNHKKMNHRNSCGDEVRLWCSCPSSFARPVKSL